VVLTSATVYLTGAKKNEPKIAPTALGRSYALDLSNVGNGRDTDKRNTFGEAVNGSTRAVHRRLPRWPRRLRLPRPDVGKYCHGSRAHLSLDNDAPVPDRNSQSEESLQLHDILFLENPCFFSRPTGAAISGKLWKVV
jgi:hypothetical protein